MQPPVAPTYQPPAPWQPKKKSNKTLMVIAAIVVVVIIGAAVAVGLGGSKSSGGSILGSVNITSSSVRPFLVDNSAFQADSGNQYVQAQFNITNEYIGDVKLNPYYFKLTASDGLSYSYSIWVNYSMPASVPGGSYAQVVLGFEIPSDRTPTLVTFNNGAYTCSCGLASVWNPQPISPNKVNQIVASEARPFVKDSASSLPDAGNKFVIVFFNFTYGGVSETSIYASDFKLTASNGLIYSYSYTVDNTGTTIVTNGMTVPFYLGFEIPVSATPTNISYDDSLLSQRCNCQLSGVWNSQPIVPAQVNRIVASEARPFVKDSASSLPDAGNKFVIVFFNFTYGGVSETSIYASDFKLTASNGLIYSYTGRMVYSPTATMTTGMTMPFFMGFEIPESVIPTNISYDDSLLSQRCNCQLSGVWNSQPIVPAQVNQIVASEARPYVKDSSSGLPDAGNKFVIVFFNFTYGGVSQTSIYASDFKLTASNGLIYSYTYDMDYTGATIVTNGMTVPFYLGFEIPESTTPSNISYDDSLLSQRCACSLVDVWNPTPIHSAELSFSTPSYQVTVSGSIYVTPDPGNRFINVMVTVTNLKSSSLTLSTIYFELTTSDGLIHQVEWLLDYNVPSGLAVGASANLVLPFEISLTTNPVSLSFDNYSTFLTLSF